MFDLQKFDQLLLSGSIKATDNTGVTKVINLKVPAEPRAPRQKNEESKDEDNEN